MATLLATACLFAGGRAGATTVTTTSFSTWNSSAFTTGGYSYLNFYPITQSFYNTASGITLTPSSSSTAFQFTGIDGGNYYLAGDTSQKTLSSAANSSAYIQISFPNAGENAFLLGTGATAAKPLLFSLSDGESFTVSSAVFGVSLSSSVSWLRLSAAGSWQATVSDFYYAASSLPQTAPGGGTPAPSPTPEPATIVMTCAGGLLLLVGSRKWKAAKELNA